MACPETLNIVHFLGLKAWEDLNYTKEPLQSI